MLSGSLGDVKINGKWYRIDLESYRSRDVVDFSPRASSPGGGIILSDLMLYQPLMQTDWRHGFGFIKYDDPQGYMKSVGNIDTRHEGIAMMYTQEVSSDTGNYRKVGGVMHQGVPYCWGPRGIRKYDVAARAWQSVTASTVANTMFMMSLGEALIACPQDSRIRTTSYDGEVKIQPAEGKMWDAWLSEHDPTVNKSTSETLKFGHIDGGDAHIYLKFPLTKIPTGATITEAKLTFMVMGQDVYEDGGSIPKLHVSRLKRDAVESEVTWNKASSSVTWTEAGGTNTTDDIESASLLASSYSDGHATMDKDTREFFTLTLDPTEFKAMVDANKGMLIYVDEASTHDNYVEFAGSKEVNEDWRPYLKVKYTKTGDWQDTGEDTNSKNYHWGITHSGFTYMGVKDTNRVHYSASATLSDIEGTDADPSHIKVGSSTTYTIGAISFMGKLYVAKPDGLWQIGDDKVAKRTLDFSSEASDQNFKSMTIHNGYLIFPIRDVIYQWNGTRLNRLTPPRISDDWPYVSYGTFANFITVGDYLYCTARTNETAYTESLFSYDGTGWHKLADLITNGYGKITMLFFDPADNMLWIHKSLSNNGGVTTTNITYGIEFQPQSEFPYARFPTTGTHSLYSAIHDMGFSRITKSSPSILVEADNLTPTTTYLEIYYCLDKSGIWKKFGTVNQDGITQLNILGEGGATTVEYKNIQLRVDFITTSATQSPILKGLTLRFLMRPDVGYGWNFNIVAADHFIYGEHEDARTADIIIKDIQEARRSEAPVEFKDLHDNTYYVYVSTYSETAQERNTDVFEGNVPSIESVVNVNLVEAV